MELDRPGSGRRLPALRPVNLAVAVLSAAMGERPRAGRDPVDRRITFVRAWFIERDRGRG
jgi:hypothetical protein